MTLQSVVVGSSASTPLANEVFSGLLLEDTLVNAVVVSEMVGRGRPMTVTTAAAIPPAKMWNIDFVFSKSLV